MGCSTSRSVVERSGIESVDEILLKFAFRLFLSLVGIALGLLIAEDVVRRFGLAPEIYRIAPELHRLTDTPGLGYEPVPHVALGGEATNADGRRDFDYPRVKEEGVFRIAVLGDSIAYGWGTALWETHPKVIEDALNRFRKSSAPRYEVLNFGVRGYNTLNEAACLKHKALAWDPDLVIVSYYHNDPDPGSVDLAALLDSNEAAKRRLADMNRLAGRAQAWLFRHSRLYTFARYRWEAHRRRDGRTDDRYSREVNYSSLKAEYFFRVAEDHGPRVVEGFARIAITAAKAGIPVVVAVFPVLDDLQNYAYVDLHRGVAGAAREAGFDVVDTLPAFRKLASLTNEHLAVDDNHPNARGQRAAGWAVATHLVERGLLPTPKTGFDAGLFANDAALTEPDYPAIHADRAMYWIERGHRHAVIKEWESAARAALIAMRLAPGNPIVRRTLEDAAAHLDGELLAETRASLSRYSRSSTASAD